LSMILIWWCSIWSKSWSWICG